VKKAGLGVPVDAATTDGGGCRGASPLISAVEA